MINLKNLHYYQAVVLPIMVLLSVWSCQRTQVTDRFTVSIAAEKLLPDLQEGKRITQYKIKLTSAHLYGVQKIQDDWWIQIMPAREEYQIDASAGHGASWLTIDDVRQGALNDIMIIEEDKEGGKLKIAADISIDIPSEEEEKHILIEEKDMLIRPYGKQ